MKVPHSKDVASHTVPESCVAYREVRRVALTGVRIGQPSSRESFNIQDPDAVSVAEGNTGLERYRKLCPGPAWSETPACSYAPCLGTGRSLA